LVVRVVVEEAHQMQAMEKRDGVAVEAVEVAVL
jgi:hypothetical protein